MAMKDARKVSPSQEWKARMRAARESLPEGVGQQPVLEWVAERYSELDTIKYLTRWKNAWNMKAADVEITKAVEEAAAHFNREVSKAKPLIARQKLHRPH